MMNDKQRNHDVYAFGDGGKMKVKKRTYSKFNELIREGIVDSTTVRDNCEIRKNQVTYGYMCSECTRIYSVSVQTKVILSQHSVTEDMGSTYKLPNIKLNPLDSIIVECPACGHEMQAVLPNIAEIIRDWSFNLGFDTISVDRPVSSDGTCFANVSIDFMDDMAAPHMKALIDAVVKEGSYDNHYGIHMYVKNRRTDEVVEIEDRITDELKRLIETPDSMITLWESEHRDLSTFDGKSHVEGYLHQLGASMKEILKV